MTYTGAFNTIYDLKLPSVNLSENTIEVDRILSNKFKTPEEKQLVVVQFARLVKRIASIIWKKKIGRHWGSFEDVFQEGIIGLYRAINGYNAENGTKFISYAYSCVYRHIIAKAIEGSSIIRVPHNTTLKCKEEDELDEKFNTALQLAYKRTRNITSIQNQYEDECQIEDKSLNEKEFKNSLEEVKKALSNIKERQADILKRRMGLENYEEQTLQEIGDFYKISKERTRQLEESAINKLKNWLKETDPDTYNIQVARSKIFKSNKKITPIDIVAETVAQKPKEEEITNGNH